MAGLLRKSGDLQKVEFSRRSPARFFGDLLFYLSQWGQVYSARLPVGEMVFVRQVEIKHVDVRVRQFGTGNYGQCWIQQVDSESSPVSGRLWSRQDHRCLLGQRTSPRETTESGQFLL